MVDSDIEDSAFAWEAEAVRSRRPRSAPPPTAPGNDKAPNTDWVTLRQAGAATGIPVPTLRKWARRNSIPNYLAPTSGGTQLRMVSLKAVQRRSAALGREAATASASASGPGPAAAEAPQTESVAPPGTMLVPIDAWDKMLLQLGNLHQAGEQLADARERAAKAETEAKFLKERLTELKTDLAAERATTSRRGAAGEDRPPAPISRIPIEAPEEGPDEDAEIVVRDLGGANRSGPPSEKEDPDEAGMTVSEYSLEMLRHIYSTWRRRPRR